MKKIVLSFLAAFMTFFASPGFTEAVNDAQYEAKDYSHLLGMPGFSDDLLIMHFKLYQGYVKTTNMIGKTIKELSAQDNTKNPEYYGMKRMYGWEFDGMRLHEYYFDNLGGNKGLNSTDPLNKRFTQEFGSYDEWKKDFVATGLIRGIGWAVLYVEPTENRLVNAWINEHDLGHLAGAKPLLVMDVFEHAYMPQYGLDRAKYIDAFFQNIDWSVVSKRYQEATK